MCGKICYDKRGAQAELNLVKHPRRKYRIRNKNRKEVRYYYCEECGAYHLTSQELEDREYVEWHNKEEFFNKLKQIIDVE